MIDAAIAYAARGWYVLPLRPAQKIPATAHGLRDASRDPAVIRAWWHDEPRRNVGIATGAHSGIVVIDIDSEAARATWWRLCETHGGRISTLAQRTGRGWQLFFAHPGGKVKNSASDIAAGIDVRGDGGYVVAPPSVHPDGPTYRWVTDDEPVACPPWLAAIIAPPAPSPQPTGTPSTIAAGGTPYGLAALERETHDVACTPEGGRNARLNVAAYALGQLVAGGELELRDAEQALITAGCASGLPPGEVARTVASGIAAGQRDPRSAPVTLRDRSGTEPPPIDAPAPDDADADPSDLDDQEWRHCLLGGVDRFGAKKIKACAQNALLLCTHHPAIADRIAWDVWRQCLVWTRPPPWGGDPGDVASEDADRLSLWLAQHVDLLISADACWRAIAAIGHDHPLDRLRDWLDTLRWDGRDRLSTWLVRYAGAPDTPYVRAVSRAWMISAVARAHTPGCQADHMLVLEGEQGCGKTSTLRALAGDEWHAEVTLAATRDGVMDLHGPWIVEWSELAGLGRTEIESVKALVSRRVDRLRLPYARTTVDLPRRCVMAATTNEEGWATDQSGNRRYWPVPVAACDPHALATARDQLWAEARDALVTQNEAWWLSRTETALAAREQAARLPDDPWLDTVDAALSSGRLSRRESVTQDDIADVLDIDLERRHPGTARRIASVMRAIGWPSYRRREDGARCRGWTRPSSPKAGPDDRQHHLGQDTTHPGQHDDPVPDGPDDDWGGPDA